MFCIGSEKLIYLYSYQSELTALSEQESQFVNRFGCPGLPRPGLDSVVCTGGAVPTPGAEEDQPHGAICLLNIPAHNLFKNVDIYFGLDTVVCKRQRALSA